MSVDVREGVAHTFTFWTTSVWAAATAHVLDPGGVEIETPTATVVGATVNDSTSMSGATNSLTAVQMQTTTPQWNKGDRVFVDQTAITGLSINFESAIAEIDRVNDQLATIHFIDPLPGVPLGSTSGTVTHLGVTVPITAITDRAKGYRVIIRETTTGEELTQVFHVVYHPWANPVDELTVRRYVANHWPGASILDEETELATIATDAGRVLRNRLFASQAYPHTFWDAEDMKEAGLDAMRLVLADRNYIPGGTADPVEYRRTVGFDLRDRVGDILRGAFIQDRDADDAADADELAGVSYAPLVR